MQIFNRIFGRAGQSSGGFGRGGNPGFPTFVDWLIVGLILFSLLMIYGPGGGLAVIAGISIIGLPIAVVMWLAPFATLILLCWRAAFLLLRFVLSGTPAILGGLAVALIGLFAVDRSLMHGPHPDIARLLAHDDPVQRIAPLPGGRLAFADSDADPADPADCGMLCRHLLATPYVSELVVAPHSATPISVISRDHNAPCPAGWTGAGSFTCQRPFTGTAPVTLTTTRLNRADLADGFAPEHRAVVDTLVTDPDRPLHEATRVALSDTRSGTTTIVHVLRAGSAVAGLFGLDMSGIMGEELTYGPRIEPRSFSSLPDFPRDTPSSKGLRGREPDHRNAHIHLLVRALEG